MAAAARHHGLVNRGDAAGGRGLRSPLPPAPPAPREVPGAVAARRDGRHRAFGAGRQTARSMGDEGTVNMPGLAVTGKSFFLMRQDARDMPENGKAGVCTPAFLSGRSP